MALLGAGVELGATAGAGAGEAGVFISMCVFDGLAGAASGAGLIIVVLLGGVAAGACELITTGVRSTTVETLLLL